MSRTLWAWLALASVLAACSGGGGGPGAGGSAAPTQTSSFGATSSTTPAPSVAATFSNSTLDPPATDATGAQSSVTISPSQNSFSLAITTGGVTYNYTFSGQNSLAVPAFLSGFTALGDGSSQPANILIYDGALSYAVFGMWEHDNDDAAASGTLGAFATGTQTPAQAIPTSGTASYFGLAIGALSAQGQSYSLAGSSSFTADFGAQTVNGAMALDATPDGGVTVTPWNTVTVSAGILPGTSRFTGTASTQAVSNMPIAPAMVGNASGNFYGAQANAIAGIWSIAGGGATALGSFGGSTPSPTGGTSGGVSITASFGINTTPIAIATPGGTIEAVGAFGAHR